MTSIPNRNFHTRLGRLRTVGGKGFFAVIDQGFFSGTNFLVNLGLARWLPPDEYGAFALVYAIFILFSIFYAALFIEPMLVFGPGKYKHNFQFYLRYLRRVFWRASLGLGVIFALVGGILLLNNKEPLAMGFFGAAFMAPVTLLTWLLRRSFYARFKPQIAATGAIIFFVFSAGLFFGCAQLDSLTIFPALICLTLSNLAALVFFSFQLEAPKEGTTITSNEVLLDHWRYGKWNMVGAGFDWVPSNIYLLILPLWFGLETSGALKALMNLALPLTHFNSAIGILLLPTLATTRGSPRFATTGKAAMTLLCVVGLLFWGVMGACGEDLLEWVYAGKYTEHAHLLWVLALLPTFSGVVTVLRSSIKAITIPRWITFTSGTVGIINLIAAIALTTSFGLHGAVVGATAGVLLLALALSLFFTRQEHRQLATAPSTGNSEL